MLLAACALVAAGLLIGGLPGCAGEPARTHATQPQLRVGCSGDYSPFALADKRGALHGFDVDLARAYAADRGLELVLVRFRWAELERDLQAGRFDLAWSGVTVRPERSVVGRFAVPTAQTGAVVLVPTEAGLRELSDLDRPGLRLAVNQGGHLERVARGRFPRARIVAVARNQRVLDALREGLADAVVSDGLEAPHWMARSQRPLRLIGPFTHDWKAPWARPELRARVEDLSRWLVERELDGSLAALRARHGLANHPRTALPEAALTAAREERLGLMPWVAEAKRRRGDPIKVPEREAVVRSAGLQAVHRAARLLGREPPTDAEILRFYQREIEAAKQLQGRVLSGPPRRGPIPDLETALRPALLRIGERIAWLLAWRAPPTSAARGEVGQQPLAVGIELGRGAALLRVVHPR